MNGESCINWGVSANFYAIDVCLSWTKIFHLMFSPGVTLVDSPGFNSSIADMEELVWLLADLQQVL